MTLDDIPDGSRVLVDANIIIYMLGRKSPQCSSLLARCDSGTVQGWITSNIAAEVCHRRMMQEAQSCGLAGSNPARALGQNKRLIQQLTQYANETRDLLGGGLEVETVKIEDYYLALELQSQHGLLTIDSLNLAVARRLGIQEIATTDSNFDHIPGLIVYKPGDLAA
jgi:predicted nucleic acid-binding protein